MPATPSPSSSPSRGGARAGRVLTLWTPEDKEFWEKWFPADFITESFPGQFRNWFYAILAMSTMMTQRVPFEVLLGHALVRDQKGQEMHKSLGNAIPFDEAAEKKPE